ncbi:hypothetical protein [Bartonella jaculi]|uniref:Uncharacterized protein n=1 Tax=Bartonella jaculi TaxID=686226 RepID=A0ABP9MXJ7_9HYPH
MVKLFKNNVLSIFMAIAFSFLQVVNVNANYLKNNSQQETPVSVVKQKAISTAALYNHNPDSNHWAENETATEGKIEPVVDPITIAVGVVIGTYVIGTLLGWMKDFKEIFFT